MKTLNIGPKWEFSQAYLLVKVCLEIILQKMSLQQLLPKHFQDCKTLAVSVVEIWYSGFQVKSKQKNKQTSKWSPEAKTSWFSWPLKLLSVFSQNHLTSTGPIIVALVHESWHQTFVGFNLQWIDQLRPVWSRLWFCCLGNHLVVSSLIGLCAFRCNFALMLLAELVLDQASVDWEEHLPLMLHVIFLGELRACELCQIIIRYSYSGALHAAYWRVKSKETFNM